MFLARAAVVPVNSRRCHIAGREHSANHVYLVLFMDGRVAQRCHSAACAGREHTLPQLHHTLASLLQKKKTAASTAPLPAKTRGAHGAAFWLARLERTK
jgi:hypothetical protein